MLELKAELEIIEISHFDHETLMDISREPPYTLVSARGKGEEG